MIDPSIWNRKSLVEHHIEQVTKQQDWSNSNQQTEMKLSDHKKTIES
jgi:hypothetical protein